MGLLNNLFYNIAKAVAYHPIATFLAGILATVACGFGFMNLWVTVSQFHFKG